MSAALNVLQQQVIACNRCPRLRAYCLEVARKKRRAYLDWEYWGKPVPAFGDPEARVMIVGLAPAAHGANRTGRMFTGDASGDFLYRVLHQTGFASQAESRSRDDGLTLRDVWITASARCAPPDNKPTREELANCRPYLEGEIALLAGVRVVVALGRIAFDTYLSILHDQGRITRKSAFAFGHGVEHQMGDGLPTLIASYHPSRQNTSTRRLTEKMLRDVFTRTRDLLGDRSPRSPRTYSRA